MMALMLIFGVACDGDDGATGPAGTTGANGTDGTDGQDGNANVLTYTFDTSAENGQIWDITATQLTQDVLDNDAILAYLRRGTSYYPTPGTSFGDEIKLIFLPDTAQFLFYDRMSGANLTPSVGTYDLFKMVIIESSSTTAGKNNLTSPTQQVYNELANAGVDVNNYEDVMDYYGLEY